MHGETVKNTLSKWYFVGTKTEIMQHVLKCTKSPCCLNTGTRRLTTFRSTTDRMYDGGPIIL